MLSLEFLYFHWGVLDDQCSNDHSPIFLKSNNSTPEETNPKWLFHKADWISFKKIYSTLIDEEIPSKPDPMSPFTNTLIKKQNKQSLNPPLNQAPKTNPLFIECREAVKTRKKCSSFLNTTLPESIFKKIPKAQGKICYIIQKETWRNYISILNNISPINKT